MFCINNPCNEWKKIKKLEEKEKFDKK